jgi:hypothetical protein
VIALRRVAEMNPSDPIAHLALAGLFQTARNLIAHYETEWEKADEDTRTRWRRDLPLLVVAETARQKRTDAAWRDLAAESLR